MDAPPDLVPRWRRPIAAKLTNSAARSIVIRRLTKGVQMKRMTYVTAMLAAAALWNGMAQAQNEHTFVSGSGSDSNPCSLVSPCRTFAQAISVTNAGGEIVALDSAGFGTVTINKAISIVATGGAEGLIAVPQGQINAGTGDVVSLRGLTIDGRGAGQYGILVNSGGTIEIAGTLIHNLATDGIRYAPSGAPTTLTITNSTISDNGNDGVYVFGATTNSSAGSTIVVDHVVANHNGFNTNNFAFEIWDARMMISNSVVSNNVTGICQFNYGVIRIAKSVITGNSNGLYITGDSGSGMYSYGDNYINGNGTDVAGGGALQAVAAR